MPALMATAFEDPSILEKIDPPKPPRARMHCVDFLGLLGRYDDIDMSDFAIADTLPANHSLPHRTAFYAPVLHSTQYRSPVLHSTQYRCNFRSNISGVVGYCSACSTTSSPPPPFSYLFPFRSEFCTVFLLAPSLISPFMCFR